MSNYSGVSNFALIEGELEYLADQIHLQRSFLEVDSVKECAYEAARTSGMSDLASHKALNELCSQIIDSAAICSSTGESISENLVQAAWNFWHREEEIAAMLKPNDWNPSSDLATKLSERLGGGQ